MFSDEKNELLSENNCGLATSVTMPRLCTQLHPNMLILNKHDLVLILQSWYVVAEHFCLSTGGLSTKFGQVGDC